MKAEKLRAEDYSPEECLKNHRKIFETIGEPELFFSLLKATLEFGGDADKMAVFIGGIYQYVLRYAVEAIRTAKILDLISLRGETERFVAQMRSKHGDFCNKLKVISDMLGLAYSTSFSSSWPSVLRGCGQHATEILNALGDKTLTLGQLKELLPKLDILILEKLYAANIIQKNDITLDGKIREGTAIELRVHPSARKLLRIVTDQGETTSEVRRMITVALPETLFTSRADE